MKAKSEDVPVKLGGSGGGGSGDRIDLIVGGGQSVLVDRRRRASCDPATADEYTMKFNRNTFVHGKTALDMQVTTACPCCAEPGFMSYPVMRAAEALAAGATCRHCGRTVRQMPLRLPNNSITYEYIQTGGKDPPDYLTQIRRLSDFK